MKYHAIGEGSDQLIFCLEGVGGGVITIINLIHGDYVLNTIFAIRQSNNDQYVIRKEFVDEDTEFAGRHLSSTWGWSGKGSTGRNDVLTKFKCYYKTSAMNILEAEIPYIESQFTIIKDVYDRNISRQKVGNGISQRLQNLFSRI